MSAPHLDLAVAETCLEEGAVAVLAHIRPAWQPENVSFKVFTDGITNKLIGCFNTKFPTDVILVRVYGQKTELLIDREVETDNIKLLQEVGFAPPLFATFNNGLAYQYIPGEVLSVETVRSPDVFPLVARKMAELHKLRLNNNGPAQPALWANIEKFISLIPQRYSDPEKHQRYVSLVAGGVEGLRRELAQLSTALAKLGSPVVFCHNDLLLANVIYRPGAVSFIDYEYAACNYQAFDIGNHFTEFAGVAEVDYARYPDRELQLAWLRDYLEEFSGREPTSIELETLYAQVNKFALGAHFMWATWALVQAEHSLIPFDFMQYASLRLNEYFDKKESFLALEMSR